MTPRTLLSKALTLMAILSFSLHSLFAKLPESQVTTDGTQQRVVSYSLQKDKALGTHLRGLPERRPKNETQRYVSLNGQAWKEGASSYLIEGLQADTEYTVEFFVKDLAQNTASYGQQKAKTAKPSAIANLLQEEQKGATLYDLSRRCQQELKVGINIIRTKEGKTKRILVR